MLGVICSSSVFADAEEKSFFEKTVRGFLDFLFPLSGPQFSGPDIHGGGGGGSGGSVCSNGIIDPGEECDCGRDNICTPGELDGETCVSLGFDKGDLDCSNCMFDTSLCGFSAMDSSSNLILRFDFEEGSGNFTADNSGNGNDGLLMYDAAFTTNSRIGNYSMSFDGNQDNVNVTYDSSMAITDGLTIGAWVNPENITSGYDYVLSKGFFNGTTPYLDYGLGWWNVYNNGMILRGVVTIDGNQTNIHTPVLTPDTWTHIVVTYSDADDLLSIYMDGVLFNSTFASGIIDDSGTGIFVGGYEHIQSESFNGSIDDVRIYDVALTPQEVLDYYNGEIPIPCEDGDGDGYNVTGGDCGPIDCNDTDRTIWNLYDMYLNMDHDPYGVNGVIAQFCYGNHDLSLNSIMLGNNWALNTGDCDDSNNIVYPGATEICDGIDNSCDNVTDNLTCDCYAINATAIPPLWNNSQCNDTNNCTYDVCVTPGTCLIYPALNGTSCVGGECFGGLCVAVCEDGDGDGYNITGGDCGPIDCNDTNPNINPGANEICNNLDDNCDNRTDSFNETCGSGFCIGERICEFGVWSDCDSFKFHPRACSACNSTGEEIYDESYTDLCEPSYCSGFFNYERFYQECKAIGECTEYQSELCSDYWVDDTYCNLTTGDIETHNIRYNCTPEACVFGSESLTMAQDCEDICQDDLGGVFDMELCNDVEQTACPYQTFIDSCNETDPNYIIDYSCDGNDYIFSGQVDCDIYGEYTCGIHDSILRQYMDNWECTGVYPGVGCSYINLIETGLTIECDNSRECTYSSDNSSLDCGNESYICYHSNDGEYKWRIVLLDSETNCDDGHDNDCDGFVDCDDSNCDGDPACQEINETCEDFINPLDCEGDMNCDWCHPCEDINGPRSLTDGGDYCSDLGTCGPYVCDSAFVCNNQAQCDEGEISTVIACIDSFTALNQTFGCNESCMREITESLQIDCDSETETCVEGFGCLPVSLDIFNLTLDEGWNFISIPLNGIANGDPDRLNSRILLAYDEVDGWSMNYNGVNQIEALEPARGYIALSDTEQEIDFVGVFDESYAYELSPTNWTLLGSMINNTLIGDVYGAGDYSVYAWNGNSFDNVSDQNLIFGEAYWAHIGVVESPPEFFTFLDVILRILGLR